MALQSMRPQSPFFKPVATAENVLDAGQTFVGTMREAVERAKSALGMAPPALLNAPKKSSRT